MIRHLAPAIAAAVVLAAASAAHTESWIFKPAAFSHDPASGGRVAQFLPVVTAYRPYDDTYAQSGYRHLRTTIRGADGSADRLHIVETWGAGEAIRPYGEWQFPFRAGATPYGPWGNPRGPWTMPFDSWNNPYGLWNRYGNYYPWYGRGAGHSHASPHGSAHGPHGSPPGPPP